MTTAPPPPGLPPRPVRVSREVRTAAACTLGPGLVAVGLAALVAGDPGALGAGIGVAMVLVFFGFGALTVDAVATVSPAASLLVALLTYTLQVVAVGLVFLVLAASGRLGTSVDEHWLAGAVILGTLVWLVAHIVAATRSRQPLYDLPAAPPTGVVQRPETSAR